MSEQPDIKQAITGNEHAATSGTGSAAIYITNYYYYYYREDNKVVSVESTDAADEDTPCPYRSLFHFSPDDAEFFFGREVFVEELFSATKNRNFIPVLGASGSGKSSVVLAGLVPKLQQAGHWKFTHFRPGSDTDSNPFFALARALVSLYTKNLDATDKIIQARKLAQSLGTGEIPLADVFAQIHQNYPTNKVLLIADQFEEIYTLCADQKIRRSFLDTLLASFQSSDCGTSSSTVLVATMRADFLPNALSYRPFADMLQNADIKLGAMSQEELTSVIEKPAQKSGVTFEGGLVQRILNDVKDEPGNLPLLEFALTELWKKRTEKQLTHEAYEAIGQVKGALADYADDKYKELILKEKEQARCIFIQLVSPGEGIEDTRRRVNRSELGDENWNLITRKDGLADSRLVVTNINDTEQETVEIVHEALIQNWSRLREWMETNRKFRIWQERLRTRIQEWKDGKGELLSKIRLEIAEEWLHQHRQELSPEQKNFIKKSQKKRKRNQWLVTGVTSLILIFTFIAGNTIYKSSCEVGERIGQDCFRFIITSGDSKLFVGSTDTYLEYGVKDFNSAFPNLNFFGKWIANPEKIKKVLNNFKHAQNIAPSDPVPQIYHNNAKALSKGNPYKLAVVVPVDSHEEVARNMLRGVAYAQNEFNKEREGKNLPLLEIMIANDINPNNDNQKQIVKTIANKLSEKEALAIIGHRSSGSSLTATEIYEQKKIAIVSPTSSSTKLDKFSVFTRTVDSNKIYAELFYEYTKKKCLSKDNNNKVWVLHDTKKASYSEDFKEQFENEIQDFKKQFYFNDFIYVLKLIEGNKFKEQIKNKIHNNGLECIIILPNTNTIDVGVSIINAYKELYKEKNKLNEYKINFLSGLTLDNRETSKKNGVLINEELIIIVPTPFPKDKTIKSSISKAWEGKVSWRTYTSYKATKILTEGLKKVDKKESDEKNTTSKKRKLLRNHLNKSFLGQQKKESCLMDFKDSQNNKHNLSNSPNDKDNLNLNLKDADLRNADPVCIDLNG